MTHRGRRPGADARGNGQPSTAPAGVAENAGLSARRLAAYLLGNGNDQTLTGARYFSHKGSCEEHPQRRGASSSKVFRDFAQLFDRFETTFDRVT